MPLPRTMTWFLVLLGAALLGLAMTATGVARPLQASVQRVAAPLESALHDAVAPLSEALSNIFRYKRLSSENEALRAENERLVALLAGSREATTQNLEQEAFQRLEARLGAGKVTRAGVIGSGTSPLRRTVAVDRGSRDGVVRGMAVLTLEGSLLGTVESVTESTSWVRLLTDPRSGVNGMLQESRARALVTASDKGDLRMDVQNQGVDVKPGDMVLTSGLGGMLPAALPIGRVQAVQGGPLEAFRTVIVEPAGRLTVAGGVAIYTGHRPTPMEGSGR